MRTCGNGQARTNGDGAAGVQETMRELSGAIIGASLIQVAIGYSGLMGLLLKYISPLTIAPTIALVGLALIDAGALHPPPPPAPLPRSY